MQHEVDHMVGLIAPATCSDARWLIADFQNPQHGWRRVRARLRMRLLYAFFGRTAVVPTRDHT